MKMSAPADKNIGSSDNDRAAELGKGFGALLEKALIEPDGGNAVAEARAAIADGTLESQAAYDAAAANILNLGI